MLLRTHVFKVRGRPSFVVPYRENRQPFDILAGRLFFRRRAVRVVMQEGETRIDDAFNRIFKPRSDAVRLKIENRLRASSPAYVDVLHSGPFGPNRSMEKSPCAAIAILPECRPGSAPLG